MLSTKTAKTALKALLLVWVQAIVLKMGTEKRREKIKERHQRVESVEPQGRTCISLLLC